MEKEKQKSKASPAITGDHASAAHSSPSSALTDGEFLLHLLRKGNNQANNGGGEGDSTDKRRRKQEAIAGSSSSADEEPWQLKDPAVAALGPSHRFRGEEVTAQGYHHHLQSPSPLPHPHPHPHPHGWLHLHSSPAAAVDYRHVNHDDANVNFVSETDAPSPWARHPLPSPLPCSFDPSLLQRPPTQLQPQPQSQPQSASPYHPVFSAGGFQIQKPYDKSFPEPCSFVSPGGGDGGGASSSSPFNENDHLGISRVLEAPWMTLSSLRPPLGAGGESGGQPPTWSHDPQPQPQSQPRLVFSGSKGAANHHHHGPTFTGDVLHQQKHWPQSYGNGADLFQHLQGLSEENGFLLGSFGVHHKLNSTGGNATMNEIVSQKCVGSANLNVGDFALNRNQKCVGGSSNACYLPVNESQNSSCQTGSVPCQSWSAVAEEQFSRDGNLMFGSVVCQSERDRSEKMLELQSGNIFLNNAELPCNLQGKGAVRLLCRPSSSQQVSGNKTVPEEELPRKGHPSNRLVDEPRVSRGASTPSPEQVILKDKRGLDQESRNAVRNQKSTSRIANTFDTDDRKKGPEIKSYLQIERNSNQSIARGIRHGQSDIIGKDDIRNGAAQRVIKERHARETGKESVEVIANGEGMGNHSLKSRGRGIYRHRDDFKKCGEIEQEWDMKESQTKDQKQSGVFDSFSTITDHLSALEVNEFGHCKFNEDLKKHILSRISDDASCSQPVTSELENPRSSSGSNLHSVPASQMEKSHRQFHGVALSDGNQRSRIERRRQGKHFSNFTGCRYQDFDKEDTGRFGGENQPSSDHDSRDKYCNENRSIVPRFHKDSDSDINQEMVMAKHYQQQQPMRLTQKEIQYHANQNRRQHLTRPRRKEIQYRADLEMLTSRFLLIYESLIPGKEEEAKRKQLIFCLEKVINRVWPGAQLHLFGSCANAFGVSKSDIDVCLSINDEECTKPELVLKLAEILEAEDMHNVQALTHARVPIVKFTDPLTGISCDICINNILAVVNTKLLYDYAQIDVRLQQLAFMVKHWAKNRQINETYQGTLSSYAYVLMCIHFLQQRRPPILPCLQEMEATYQVVIGEIECAYYDQVEKLKNYGAGNKETLGQLLSAFFHYWAFRHDYANSVISVRTGGLLSKNEKDWTRRIGNERHLICIEDPFEISHDLGRVVDKHSIRVLKEEFHRAAEIMQDDPDPSVTLFMPYVRS